MRFVYERCGHCSRKGAYAVPDREMVRCKYCTRATATTGVAAPILAEAAASLEDLVPEGGAAARPVRRSGVWRMDPGVLWALTEPPVALPRQPTRPSPPGPARPERVFVVDDDEDVRGLVAVILRAAGFSVSEAADGRTASPPWWRTRPTSRCST